MAGSQMQLEDWLDDLCVRFIINLPEEDLSSVARLCFQVEEAQWFYEDFIRPLDPSLPSMSLRTFCLRIFQHCPLLASFSVENHTRAFEEFLQYKTRVPVRGAILLNQEMDSTVLVKGWKKSANWSFPRGKINKDEDDLDCAVREVWEETGLDLKAAGLVPSEGKPKYIEISMREQQMRLYVFRDVPMNTHFEPQTRKEISKIQWYKLSELPAFRKKGGQNDADATTNANKFYMVAPFLVPLKKWVTSQKKIEAKKVAAAGNRNNLNPHFSVDEAPTEDDTWAQHMPTIPSHGPALDTLEGATNELQRLLKVQPPTQGLQPTTQEDKATALLSMLKVGGASQLGQPLPSSQMPQTPLELNAEETPQPRNPHHHSNQHQPPFPNNQPPPAFNLHQHQYQQHSLLQGPQWNAPPQQQPFQGQIPARDFDGASQQPPGHFQPPLAHPQPLPPQVQRSMYSQNMPQDQAPQGHPQHMQPQQAAPNPRAGFFPPGPPQQNNAPPNEAPQSLGTQSLALLNAFKRDTGNSPSTQPRQPPVNQSDLSSNQTPNQAQQPPIPQIQNQASELAGSSTQNLPTHARKPSGQAPTDQHKSALLGMFKTNPAKASPQAQPPAQVAPPPQPGPPAGNANQQQLLGMFRRAPSSQEVAPQAMPNQGMPQQCMPQQPAPQTSSTGAALSDFLALKPSDQRVPSASRSSGRGSANQRQPSAASNPSAQPVRILQRDRGADGMNFPGQPDVVSAHSPYSNPPQPVNGSYSSPPVSGPRPSPGISQQHQHQQQGAPQDQKRQLLSLFGNKPQASPTSVVPGAVEVGSDHGLPSRRESGTPMSPAEQTFLLDYLQSVTGGAKR